LRDRNQEVLIVNSMLRSELAEVRRENEAYKQLLKLHEQERQIAGGESGPNQTELTDTLALADSSALAAPERAG
jgi:hypothetical protein